MKVIRAEVMGMCFGVRDALKVIQDLPNPDEVTIHGELVHNETVLHQLNVRGYRMVSEDQRDSIPQSNHVMITAHGISEKRRADLINAGKSLIDTTCPLVTRAHHAAQKLRDQGYFVVLIGKSGHVEVQGIVEDLLDYTVVNDPNQVINYGRSKIGIMCQTTAQTGLVEKIRREVMLRNPNAEIKFVDTVCHPTKDHQSALTQMLEKVDAVVVVGGKNSNNTKQLAIRCEENGIPAYHIQSAQDLRPQWFQNVETVGLTAGTSTLDETIEDVYKTLVALPETETATPVGNGCA